jgi:hypothetical protein
MKRAALVILATLLFRLVSMGPAVPVPVAGGPVPVVLALIVVLALVAFGLILRMFVAAWREVLTRPARVRI